MKILLNNIKQAKKIIKVKRFENELVKIKHVSDPSKLVEELKDMNIYFVNGLILH